MGDEQPQATTTRLMRTPKEGERILGPTRRPDGTLRKPIRIRAGYVPQDEVAIYQSKGALLKKAQPEHPPGYDPAAADTGKPKTKSAKRNERKKEKKLQAAQTSSDAQGKDVEIEEAGEMKNEEQHRLDSVEAIAGQISNLSVSSTTEVVSSSREQAETSKHEDSGPDIDKRIRALKKKIRLAEPQLKDDQQSMKPGQLEKMAKVEGWRAELKVLEEKKANMIS